MEEFLGVLFCGGRGTRLGEITKYISKSFVPVYDKPVFKYGLGLLEKCDYINEIIILTNDDNDTKLKGLGYKTIIQDDVVVFDMFSGWEYVKKITKTKKNGVLVPSDNISNVNLEAMIKKFIQTNCDLLFSLIKLEDEKKLSQMGCYDPEKKEFFYKHKNPPAKYGVIAPYIVNNNLTTHSGDEVLNNKNNETVNHDGFWFDIGDFDSIIEANNFISNFKKTNV